MSLVRRHRERTLGQLAATQAAGAAGVRSGAAASEYQLQLVRLGVDLRRLKELQSIEKKIDLKRELLPEYAAWVDGVLAADAGAADDIVGYVMTWRIDTGDFAGALPLAAYMVRHQLALPARFDRTAPTLIAEEIAEAALKRFGQGETFDSHVLDQVAELVADSDIYDQVRAKLEKAQGLAAEYAAGAIAPDADGPAGAKRRAQERALTHFRRALELDGNAGVKKRIEQLVREARRAEHEQDDGA